MGYLSTEVMAVEGDALIWQKVLPVGGAHHHAGFDLRAGKSRLTCAKRSRRGYTFNAPKNTQIEVQGENGQMESFSGEQVSMIIDARVDEMLEMIDDAVKKSGIRLGNWSNVYFTGGGLMPMSGARVYAAGKLARNVREAAVKTVRNSSPRRFTPAAADCSNWFITPSSRRNRTKGFSTASSAPLRKR